MPRTRRIRQVLEPKIAKQEVKNISKMYKAMGWIVHVSTNTENGSVVHTIVASKGIGASVIIELKEAKTDKKGAPEESLKRARPEPTAPPEIETKREAEPEARPQEPRQVLRTKSVERPPQLESLRKEDLIVYVEQDETGIVPVLVAEEALVLEDDGSVKIKKWFDRDKFLHAREYFKRVGLKYSRGYFKRVGLNLD